MLGPLLRTGYAPASDPQRRRPLLGSIRLQLPLLVSLFTAMVFAGFLAVTYREVDSALLRSSGERAEVAAQQVADLLGSQRQRGNQIGAVAENPDVVQCLVTDDPVTRSKAEASLRTLVGSGDQKAELVSARGDRILDLASPHAVASSFPTALPTEAGLRFDAVNHAIIATWTAAVRNPDANSPILGYVITRRPIGSSTSDALNRLIGSGARLELGASGTTQWTDLASLVPSPPIDLNSRGFRQYRTANGEDRLGALRPVTDTPWLVWVSFPRSLVTAQVHGVLDSMALSAVVFVIAMGLVSAIVTTPTVRRLSALTIASEAIAAGDFDQRVPAQGSDEVGRLGRSFNRMIGDIRDGHQRLIERAQHATCLADVSNALATSGPLPDMLSRCASAIAEHLPVAHVTVWTKSPTGPWLDRMGDAGSLRPFGAEYDKVSFDSFEIGLMARNRAAIVTNNVNTEPALRNRQWSVSAVAQAFAGYPLVVHQQLVGVLAVISHEALDDRSQATLALAGQTIAVGIARRQLEESRAQLAGILDSAADFVTIGQPDGPPMYLNRAVRHALEIGDDEHVDSLLTFRTPEFRAYFDAVILPEVDRNGSWSGESEYVSKTGRTIPVSQVSVGHRDPSGRLLYLSTIARDISDQRRADLALRESEARFRKIAETITEVFWIADVDLSRVLYVSPSYERVWGRTCESLYADIRSALDAIHPDDRDHVTETLSVRASGKPFEHEFRIVRPDGEVRWLWDRGFPVRDNTGRVVQYVGAAQDITDRKHSEDRLRLLALAVESTNEMVSVTDLNDRYTFVNRAFTEVYGYREAEIIGKTPAIFKPSSEADELYSEIGRETRRFGWEGEVPVRCKDGSEIVVNLHASPMRDDDGTLVGLLRVGRDITPKRQLEDQLRQSQKMEAIGQLAGGVAHDFNNLLTAILGYSELLGNTFPSDDPRGHDVDQIRNAANRAAALTRQLLAFSRKQILAPRVLKLGDVVRDLVPMLQRLLGETVDLKTVVADLGSIKADTSQLEQVIVNLSVNARDAMPNGGQLTIETADVRLDEAYARQHAGVQAGRYVMLAVSDSGHGMDPATQKRVFEPFFTTKPAGSGTGLGLSTVHGIVNQSGGHVWLYSEPGRGTTLKVYLPRTDAMADVEIPSISDQRTPRGHETILLVEDEAVVREFAERVLRQHGYTIHSMSDPARALEFAGRHSGHIDLILSDVVLPSMNGRDLAGRLQQRFPDAAVVFMSGYTDDAIVRHGVLEPGMWFLQKPFTADALLSKVRNVLSARELAPAPRRAS